MFGGWVGGWVSGCVLVLAVVLGGRRAATLVESCLKTAALVESWLKTAALSWKLPENGGAG